MMTTTTAEKIYGHPGILDGPRAYRKLTVGHPWEQHPVHENEKWCPNCCISLSGRNSRQGGVLCVIVMETPLPASHPGPQTCPGTKPDPSKVYFLRDANDRMLQVQRETYYGMLLGR